MCKRIAKRTCQLATAKSQEVLVCPLCSLHESVWWRLRVNDQGAAQHAQQDNWEKNDALRLPLPSKACNTYWWA